MRLSVASALPVSTVFSRIQQPTGNSFQVTAAAPAAVPALTAINSLPTANGNRGGLFGTALPKQQHQQQQHHNASHQGSRRVEVQSSPQNNNFKKERREKVRNVKGRNNNPSQGKSKRVEEEDEEDLDEVLDNYFARK